MAEGIPPSSAKLLCSLMMYVPSLMSLRAIFKEPPFDLFQLHLAALTQLKNEIFESNRRLGHVTSEREELVGKLRKLGAEKQKMQKEYEEKLQSQVSNAFEVIEMGSLWPKINVIPSVVAPVS